MPADARTRRTGGRGNWNARIRTFDAHIIDNADDLRPCIWRGGIAAESTSGLNLDGPTDEKMRVHSNTARVSVRLQFTTSPSDVLRPVCT